MIEGQTIVITGGAQGIGRALCTRIVELGGTPVALDIDAEKMAETRALLGDKGHVIACNVADEAEVEAAFARIFETVGDVHGLVNNAGILRPALIHKMEIDQWDQVLGANLTSVFLCTRAITRHMIARAKAGDKAPGSIVNISSVAGRKGSFGQINYSATKAAMLGCTMSTARETARYNIRANSVCFGMVETRTTEKVRSDPKLWAKFQADIPLGRASVPADVVEPVLFLMSPGAGYITGQHLSVDGGTAMGY